MSLLPCSTHSAPQDEIYVREGQVIAAASPLDTGNRSELFAYAPSDSGLQFSSRISPGNTLLFQMDNSAVSGALTTTCGVNNAAIPVSTVVLNQAAYGNTNGRTIFPANLPPQVGNGFPFTIPFVQNQVWAGGNNTTYTISVLPPSAVFARPYILVKSQYTSRNNDAANQVNVIPSVQVPTFPSQSGPQLTVGNSGQDSFSQQTDFVLTQGTHYNSSSTTITFSYLIGGTAGSGVCSLTALGLA